LSSKERSTLAERLRGSKVALALDAAARPDDPFGPDAEEMRQALVDAIRRAQRDPVGR
jgi:hypothetical protein